MTTYSNTSYVAKNVGTSASTPITAIASGTVAVSSLIMSNTTNAPITTSVYITRSSVNYYIVKGATVAVGGSNECIQGNRIVLQTSDILVVVSSAASSADCWVSAINVV